MQVPSFLPRTVDAALVILRPRTLSAPAELPLPLTASSIPARLTSAAYESGRNYEGEPYMRKIVSSLIYSLDGVTESPEKWVFGFDSEMMANMQSQIAEQDAVVLGRSTYELWASHWPGSTTEPFSSFINNVPKYVASKTLEKLEWNGSTLIEGSVAQMLADLKTKPGKTIGVHGSSTLVRSLLKLGLIDELRLVVPPVIAGSGRRLFDNTEEISQLKLLSSDRTSNGTLLLAYTPSPE